MTFREFVTEVRPRYRWYRHCEVLADTLQQVAGGSIRRLMVFMPPRHGKSEAVSRLFAAYYLWRHPSRWVGMASYGAALAYDLSRDARDNYQRAGGALRDDAAAVSLWRTPAGGGMWAAGVAGPITGKGFHLGIIDDPLKDAKTAASETVREQQKAWYDSTFYSREEPEGAIILVQTRWHESDLAGWLLSREESEEDEPEHWHVINLPAVAERSPVAFPATCSVSPDWRREGEALCPERYSEEWMARRERRTDPYWWNALYQQRPSAPGGRIYQREWWEGANRYSAEESAALHNACVARWITYDTALKDQDSHDFTAHIVWELQADYTLTVRWAGQERLQFPDLLADVEAVSRRWGGDVHQGAAKLREVVIEDKGSGTSALQSLSAAADSRLAGILAPFNPGTASKEYRARQASQWCRLGMVRLPEPSAECPWLAELERQLFGFPSVQHDDLVDAFTMGILYLENFLAQGYQAREGRLRRAA